MKSTEQSRLGRDFWLGHGGEGMVGRALLLVAVGGALGAVARYLTTSILPIDSYWSTLVINLIGSLLLGIIAGGLHGSGIVSDELLLLLGTGILGAFPACAHPTALGCRILLRTTCNGAASRKQDSGCTPEGLPDFAA